MWIIAKICNTVYGLKDHSLVFQLLFFLREIAIVQAKF